jgi:hypothetical protein
MSDLTHGPDTRWQERMARRRQLWKLELKMHELEKYFETERWQEVRKLKLSEQEKTHGRNTAKDATRPHHQQRKIRGGQPFTYIIAPTNALGRNGLTTWRLFAVRAI